MSGEFSTPTPSVVFLHLLCIRNNLYSKSCAVTSFFCARNVFIKNKIPDTSRHSSGGARVVNTKQEQPISTVRSGGAVRLKTRDR